MNEDARKVKVCLVGAGGWGYQHARVFADRPDVDLVAVCGRSRGRTEARAAEFGLRAYADVAEMLGRERPDLVSVCLPNQGHYEATLAVIRARHHLLVEKPLTFDLAEADALLAEASARRLFFAVNFNHRYARPIRMAREAIASGRLGQVVYATWRFGGEGASDHPHANLIETQCHGFDQLEDLCGPIASVSAEMTDLTGGGFRTLALSLRFAAGGVGSMLGTYDASYAHPETHRLEVGGTRGRLVVRDTVASFEFQPHGDASAEVWRAGYFDDCGRAFHGTFDAHVDDLLTAFRAGRQPPVHARAGRRALELAHAAIRSFESGARVPTSPAR